MARGFTPAKTSGSLFNPSKPQGKKIIGLVTLILALWFFFFAGSNNSMKGLTNHPVIYVDSKTGKLLEPLNPQDSGSISKSKKDWSDQQKNVGNPPNCAKAGKRVKATFVTLARNNELYDLVGSIRHVEDRFNHKFQYDWVFLNDEPFTDEFKQLTTALISGTTKYGLVPKEHWSYPDWIDQGKAAKAREDMKNAKIIYGDSESYRHMCRYQSGFFFRHPLMDDYDWYWRVEPGIKIHCDLDYDLFKYMEDNEKVYGFTISLHEYEATIATLWKHTKDFMKLHPEHIAKDNFMKFISDDNGQTYNMCHFWSNFEVSSVKFLRSKAYMDYFEYLDKQGGFFYERWGDAPVHSIAMALFLSKDKIHYFQDVGYSHLPYIQCPLDLEYRVAHKCHCSAKDDFMWKGYSCGRQYHDAMGIEKPKNWMEFQ